MKKGFIVIHTIMPNLGRPHRIKSVIEAESITEAYNKAIDLKLKSQISKNL